VAQWRIFIESDRRVTAERIGSTVAHRLSVEGNVVCEPYYKGGHTCVFRCDTGASSWPELVFALLGKAQTLGRSWQLSGAIEEELDAWSNEPSLKGITAIHLQADAV